MDDLGYDLKLSKTQNTGGPFFCDFAYIWRNLRALAIFLKPIL